MNTTKIFHKINLSIYLSIVDSMIIGPTELSRNGNALSIGPVKRYFPIEAILFYNSEKKAIKITNLYFK